MKIESLPNTRKEMIENNDSEHGNEHSLIPCLDSEVIHEKIQDLPSFLINSAQSN